MNTKKKRAIFLDRDGTVRSPRAFSEFSIFAGVNEAVSEMQKEGRPVALRSLSIQYIIRT